MSKVYTHGLQQNGKDSLESHLEVYSAIKVPDEEVLFQGPTILGDTSTCTDEGN